MLFRELRQSLDHADALKTELRDTELRINAALRRLAYPPLNGTTATRRRRGNAKARR